MKLSKLSIVVSAIAIAFFIGPNVGRSAIAFSPMISGEVTASPSSGTIEIDHRSYHVKANSAAAKALNNFYAGLTVDIILDGPVSSSTSEVISIVRHSGP